MPEPVALEVSDLVVAYSGRRVVDGVSFRAHSGQVTAILGPNGAGKTTTVECAEGLRQPDEGRITVLGRPAGRSAARERTGVMLQDGGLPMARSVLDVLTLACAMRHIDSVRAGDLLDLLELREVAKLPVRRLSGGQRQRVAFAVAIVGAPDLVFLDEPSAGLDPHARQRVWAVVRELREAGCAVVLTTHLLQEAEELADVVHVMSHARIVSSGSPADLISRHASETSLQATLRRPLSPAEHESLARAMAPGSLEVAGASLVLRHGEGSGPAATARLAQWCADEHVPIQTLRAGAGTLEHAYLALTGGSADDLERTS